jgi:hypothetical protein
MGILIQQDVLILIQGRRRGRRPGGRYFENI